MLHTVEQNTASTAVSPAARVGIGGPVGSGKTALIEALIPVLQRRGNLLPLGPIVGVYELGN